MEIEESNNVPLLLLLEILVFILIAITFTKRWELMLSRKQFIIRHRGGRREEKRKKERIRIRIGPTGPTGLIGPSGANGISGDSGIVRFGFISNTDPISTSTSGITFQAVSVNVSIQQGQQFIMWGNVSIAADRGGISDFDEEVQLLANATVLDIKESGATSTFDFGPATNVTVFALSNPWPSTETVTLAIQSTATFTPVDSQQVTIPIGGASIIYMVIQPPFG